MPIQADFHEVEIALGRHENMSKSLNIKKLNVTDRVKRFVDNAISNGPAVISTDFIRAKAEFEFKVDPKLNDRDARKRVIRAIAVQFIFGKKFSDSAAFFPAFYHIKQVKRTGANSAVAQVEYAFANLSLNGTSCVTAFSHDEVAAALDRQLRDAASIYEQNNGQSFNAIVSDMRMMWVKTTPKLTKELSALLTKFKAAWGGAKLQKPN